MSEHEKPIDQDKTDTKEIVTYRSICSKAPDGKHKWEPKEYYSICSLCGCMTDNRLLLE